MAHAETLAPEGVDLYGRTVKFESLGVSSAEKPDILKRATQAGGMQLRFDREKQCGANEVVITLRARHLGTAHHFNEDNAGYGGHYYWCGFPEGVYLSYARVRNSLRGVTYVLGTGFDQTLHEEEVAGFKLRFGGGVEVNYLDYFVPSMCNTKGQCRSGFDVEGVVPMPFISVGTKKCKATMHRLVPNQKIYLFGFKCGI